MWIQVGYDMTQKAASQLFDKCNESPNNVDVVELHDCFSANELITYEALGMYLFLSKTESPALLLLLLFFFFFISGLRKFFINF